MDCTNKLAPNELSIVLRAFAKCGHYDKATFSSLCGAVCITQSFNPYEIALMLNALAKVVSWRIVIVQQQDRSKSDSSSSTISR